MLGALPLPTLELGVSSASSIIANSTTNRNNINMGDLWIIWTLMEEMSWFVNIKLFCETFLLKRFLKHSLSFLTY